jgi:serine/threonine protein kinase
MSAVADTRAVSISTAGYEDGLGRRSVRFDREVGGMLECLHLRPELWTFEGSLRNIADAIASLEDERFIRIRGIERGPSGLVVVSEVITGQRLIDVIEIRQRDDAGAFGIDAALGFMLQTLPALATLHTLSIAHGALAPGRILATGAGRVVLLDGIYAAALARLNLSRATLWTNLDILASPFAGGPRFDRQADLAQAALCGLMLAIGRPLTGAGNIPSLTPLIEELREVAEIRAGTEFAQQVQSLFAALLPSGTRRATVTADYAAAEVEQIAEIIGEEGCHAAFAHLARIETRILRPAPRLVERDEFEDSDAVEDLPEVEDLSPPAVDVVVATPAAQPHAPTPIPSPVALASEHPRDDTPSFEAPLPSDTSSSNAAPATVPQIVEAPPVPQILQAPVVSPIVHTPPAPASQPALSVPMPAPVVPAPLLPVMPPPTPASPSGWVPAPAPPPTPSVFTPPPPQVFTPPPPIAVTPPPPAATPIALATPAPVPLKIKSEAPAGFTPVKPEAEPAVRALPFVDRAVPEIPSGFPWKLAAAAIIVLAVGVAGARTYMEGSPEAAAVVDPPKPAAAASAPATGTTGGVAIDTQPSGAKITLDGVDVGVAPVKLDSVAPGKHVVLITTDTATVRRTIRVEAGKIVSLDVPVYSGWVSVFSPIPLDVAEAGKTLGNTDTGKILLPPGRHTLTLSNAELGFSDTRTVEIQPGEERPLNVEPKGAVNVNAHPWAEVWIDGKKAGDTPIANLPVLMGTRIFIFKHPQYGERRLTVTVSSTASAVSVDFTTPDKRP